MNIGAQAQLPDGVYCYLTKNIIETERKFLRRSKSYSTTELLIYNSSKDTVVIEGFRRYIPHALLKDSIDTFYWDFLTISNEEPKRSNIIWTTSLELNRSALEKKETIVIPPGSQFASPVYMLGHGGYNYLKEYYKLCLYYNKNIIAEIVVKYDGNKLFFR